MVFSGKLFTLTFDYLASEVETYSHIDTFQCTPLGSKARSSVTQYNRQSSLKICDIKNQEREYKMAFKAFTLQRNFIIVSRIIKNRCVPTWVVPRG